MCSIRVYACFFAHRNILTYQEYVKLARIVSTASLPLNAQNVLMATFWIKTPKHVFQSALKQHQYKIFYLKYAKIAILVAKCVKILWIIALLAFQTIICMKQFAVKPAHKAIEPIIKLTYASKRFSLFLPFIRHS